MNLFLGVDYDSNLSDHAFAGIEQLTPSHILIGVKQRVAALTLDQENAAEA